MSLAQDFLLAYFVGGINVVTTFLALDYQGHDW
jgi:hypothetical protein